MMSVAYVDELWTWRVPIVTSVCHLLVIGYLKGFGILMIAYTEELNFNNLHLMIALGINIASVGILAPAAEWFCKIFTSSVIVFISGILVFLAMVTSSFITDPVAFIFFMGIITGLGFAGAYTPPLCLNGISFTKLRSSATGVAYAGASIGQVVMPLCFDYLIEYYTLSGTLLLIGAIFSHICALGLLLPSKVIDRTKRHVILAHGQSCLKPETVYTSPTSDRKGSRCSFTHSRSSWTGSLVFLIFICTANFAYTNQYIMFPNFVREHGHSRRLVSRLIVIQGVTDLIFRVATGIAADRLSSHGRLRLVIGALFLQGVIAVLMSLLPSMGLFIAYSVVFGITGAVFMSQWTVILVGIVGVGSFPTLLTRCMMMMGISNMVLTFLMGFLRDSVGTYSWGLLITATSACLAGFLLPPSVIVGKKFFTEVTSSGELFQDRRSCHSSDEQEETTEFNISPKTNQLNQP